MDAFLAGLLDGLRLVVDVVAGPGAAAQVAFDGRAGLSEESQWGLLQVDLLNTGNKVNITCLNYFLVCRLRVLYQYLLF